ncbi:hypothetical protein M501DRAFT_1056211 [Patellaria atrata CBS 101060]|uniref:Uncharacterized protein n=1 Tax=Patellaria atrata CBS 101060 TaxID=1346257 RepID=A0A9P4VUS6_9PEZI|nr:hypothetical protein M501DRAFT_1056211 [Patellaria atrata CBS 101060]
MAYLIPGCPQDISLRDLVQTKVNNTAIFVAGPVDFSIVNRSAGMGVTMKPKIFTCDLDSNLDNLLSDGRNENNDNTTNMADLSSRDVVFDNEEHTGSILDDPAIITIGPISNVTEVVTKFVTEDVTPGELIHNIATTNAPSLKLHDPAILAVGATFSRNSSVSSPFVDVNRPTCCSGTSTSSSRSSPQSTTDIQISKLRKHSSELNLSDHHCKPSSEAELNILHLLHKHPTEPEFGFCQSAPLTEGVRLHQPRNSSAAIKIKHLNISREAFAATRISLLPLLYKPTTAIEASLLNHPRDASTDKHIDAAHINLSQDLGHQASPTLSAENSKVITTSSTYESSDDWIIAIPHEKSNPTLKAASVAGDIDDRDYFFDSDSNITNMQRSSSASPSTPANTPTRPQLESLVSEFGYELNSPFPDTVTLANNARASQDVIDAYNQVVGRFVELSAYASGLMHNGPTLEGMTEMTALLRSAVTLISILSAAMGASDVRFPPMPQHVAFPNAYEALRYLTIFTFNAQAHIAHAPVQYLNESHLAVVLAAFTIISVGVQNVLNALGMEPFLPRLVAVVEDEDSVLYRIENLPMGPRFSVQEGQDTADTAALSPTVNQSSLVSGTRRSLETVPEASEEAVPTPADASQASSTSGEYHSAQETVGSGSSGFHTPKSHMTDETKDDAAEGSTGKQSGTVTPPAEEEISPPSSAQRYEPTLRTIPELAEESFPSRSPSPTGPVRLAVDGTNEANPQADARSDPAAADSVEPSVSSEAVTDAAAADSAEPSSSLFGLALPLLGLYLLAASPTASHVPSPPAVPDPSVVAPLSSASGDPTPEQRARRVLIASKNAKRMKADVVYNRYITAMEGLERAEVLAQGPLQQAYWRRIEKAREALEEAKQAFVKKAAEVKKAKEAVKKEE